MIAPPCARAHSSVCSTSARAAFVSSVAWWRDCSSSRAPLGLRLAQLARRFARAPSRAARAPRSARRSASRCAGARSPGGSARPRPRAPAARAAAADLLLGAPSCAAEAFWASRSSASANSAAARIRWSASMRTAWPVGSTVGRAAGGLEDAELRLELGGVAAEGVEGLAHALRSNPSPARGDVLDAAAATSTPGRLRDPVLRLSCAVPPLPTRRRAVRARRSMTSPSAATGLRLTRCPFGDDRADSELVELLRRHRVGAPVIGSTPGLVLRERDRVAEIRLAGQHHRASGRSRTRSRRAAARPCRARRAGSRTSPAAPPARCRAGRRRGLEVGLVDPERAAAELVAVADQVVREARARRRVVVEPLLPLRVGRVNGWCTAPQRCPPPRPTRTSGSR